MMRKLLAVGAALVLTAALALEPASAQTGTAGAQPDEQSAQDQAPIIELAAPWGKQGQPAVRDLTTFKRVGKMDGLLAAQLAEAAQTDRFDVLVTTSEPPWNLSDLPSGVTMDRVFGSAFNGFAAELTAAQITELQDLSTVTFIEPDRSVRALVDNATKWSGTTKARTDFYLSGDGDGFVREYSSEDVVIAIVDSGIDVGHKDLAGKVIAFADCVNETPCAEVDPYDDNGHGTHVAGIAAGSGAANSRMKGVAPGAALVGVKVIDADGWGDFSTVIEGVEWVIDHAEEYNIRIMNISLGSSDPSDGEDALSQAVNAAALSGILVTVASGNIGPDLYTIGSPAAAEGAVTVASMRDVGEGGWSLSDFSGRGPTLDGRIKPDIAAPGYRIAAPLFNTAKSYVAYSGSSMASPFVAGVAALLLQANPTLAVEDIKQILYKTAEDWGAPGQDVDYGYGRLDAYKAVAEAIGVKGKPPAGPTHFNSSVSAECLEATDDGDPAFPDLPCSDLGMLLVGSGFTRYKIEVTDPTYPVAVTLVLPGTDEAYYDMDLFLYDATDTEVAFSDNVSRQENILFRPLRKGVYYLELVAYEGCGPYVLDISGGAVIAPDL